MIIAYKTEIDPVSEQIEKISRTIGVCRFVYNLFIATNQQNYKGGKKYFNVYAFSKWLNNDYRELHFENSWIREVSSKAVKQTIINADLACKRFFKMKKGFPKFKRKHDSDTGFYVPRNNVPRNNEKDTEARQHRIKIPTLGWVKLKEYGYIPVGLSDGIGVDLGIKETATVSNHQVFSNINKTSRVKKLKRRLKREQCKFFRKINYRKKVKPATVKFTNLDEQRIKVQKAYYRLDCVRKDYINKIVCALVMTKPAYITIEDLNILGMMKNKHLSHLSKAIAEQNFYCFETKLSEKCKRHNIELRAADRFFPSSFFLHLFSLIFFPSSKMCSNCGAIKWGLKKDLKQGFETRL
ncbi:MAG: transposase [Synergistaceae bacterium]|jgi:putative transposase|nr:transposase [Synergistaceae bacterium]